MSSRPRPTRSAGFVTEAEFLALPETTTKTELVDGVIIREPSPTFGHQLHVLGIARAVATWADGQTPRPDVLTCPLDVRFADGRILQPDVLVFLEPLARPVSMPIARVPDLCIEVVSSRRTYDRVTKRLIYADAGVHEFWTVLPELRLLERWTGRKLADREEVRDRLATPLLPGLDLDLADIFGD